MHGLSGGGYSGSGHHGLTSATSGVGMGKFHAATFDYQGLYMRYIWNTYDILIEYFRGKTRLEELSFSEFAREKGLLAR